MTCTSACLIKAQKRCSVKTIGTLKFWIEQMLSGQHEQDDRLIPNFYQISSIYLASVA